MVSLNKEYNQIVNLIKFNVNFSKHISNNDLLSHDPSYIQYLMSADGNWKLESSPSLWIKSDKLPNGSFYVYGSEYDTKGLRQVLIDKYCQDMKPSEKVVEDALDSISKGISIVEYRDSKLNKILGVFGLNNK